MCLTCYFIDITTVEALAERATIAYYKGHKITTATASAPAYRSPTERKVHGTR